MCVVKLLDPENLFPPFLQLKCFSSVLRGKIVVESLMKYFSMGRQFLVWSDEAHIELADVVAWTLCPVQAVKHKSRSSSKTSPSIFTADLCSMLLSQLSLCKDVRPDRMRRRVWNCFAVFKFFLLFTETFWGFLMFVPINAVEGGVAAQFASLKVYLTLVFPCRTYKFFPEQFPVWSDSIFFCLGFKLIFWVDRSCSTFRSFAALQEFSELSL